MPVFTISLRSCNTLDKKRISSAIHAAVVKTGYPANDQFQRFVSLDEESLYVDPTYPDLESSRSNNFVLIEIMLSSGSPDARKQLLLQSLVQEFGLIGLGSNDLMVLFIEFDRLNSSFGGGRMAPLLSMPQ